MRKPYPLLENIAITDIAAEGKAIARVDDLVVFVPYVIPGDVVDLQVVKKRKNYMEARAVRFEAFSDMRKEAFCQHFGVCGGCKWQILPYTEQLRYKQQQVIDNLMRIGKIELPNAATENRKFEGFYPILGSKKTEFYRNKLEFTFSNKRWRTTEEIQSNVEPETMNAVGFHIPTLFDKVLDIEKCWLQDDISNQIRNEIRRYALANNLTFFDLRNQEGFLRTMFVRTSTTGELMIIVVFFYENKTLQQNLLAHIAEKFPQITSLLYITNSKANDTITDQKVNVFKGNEYIFEEMEGLRFKIGAKSFFQTNTEQACELYKIARNFAQLTGNELVYDLYTGTGTIANFVARSARQVIGIEYVPDAIEDAKINSEINGISNTKFFSGDMKDILNQDFINEHGKPDVIITDPPRAGMHDYVIAAMLFAAPERIVYVSCNPATQARDLSLLSEQYAVKAIQPVDMFPHTHHVENVVLLEKRL
jgi:23S rRNA (uracil1939-C5)-methyltransferase